MARKKVVKELTEEEKLEQEKERAIRDVEDRIRYVNEPTYSFKVGDNVKYGAMKEAVVAEVLHDGKAYLLRCVATNNNYGKPYDYVTYRGAMWMDIRPLTNSNTALTQTFGARLYFQNSTVESIINKGYFFGVDMNPEYQRDFVWGDQDKEYLLDSVFKGVDIGKFVFVNRPCDEQWHKDRISYEILDGKQRLNTLVSFYEDRITYKGYTFSQLSNKDKRTFLNHAVSIAELKGATKQEILETFLALNRGGREMDRGNLERVESMLNNA